MGARASRFATRAIGTEGSEVLPFALLSPAEGIAFGKVVFQGQSPDGREISLSLQWPSQIVDSAALARALSRSVQHITGVDGCRQLAGGETILFFTVKLEQPLHSAEGFIGSIAERLLGQPGWVIQPDLEVAAA